MSCRVGVGSVLGDKAADRAWKMTWRWPAREGLTARSTSDRDSEENETAGVSLPLELPL